MLNNLVKNTRDVLEGAGSPVEDSPGFTGASSDMKGSNERIFIDSRICFLAEQAKAYLLKNPISYAIKIYVLKDLGMVKLEFNLSCVEITPLALENLGLTYDSTLNINFTYNPDVSYYHQT